MRGLAWVLLAAHEVHGPIVFLEPALLEKESFVPDVSTDCVFSRY